MAFLHGVIKDVHNKQPYTVGKEGLNGVVSELQRKLCSGHDGFKRVIETVATGVGRYNREVERSNEAVRNIVTGMQKNMKSLQTQVSGILKDNSDAGERKSFSDEEVKKIQDAESLIYDSSMNCIRNADTFSKNMRTALLNIDHLNHDLRTRVNNVRNTIAHERERLDKASTKQWNDMISMNKTIIDTMNALQTCIRKHIKAEVSSLVNTLRGMVRMIRDKLVGIENDLGNYVGKLENWISDADKIVRESMDVANGLENRSVAWGAKQSIEDVTKEITRTFGEAEKYVKELVGKALQAVKEMDGKLKEDLFGVRGAIKGKVKEINRKVKELGSVFEEAGSSGVPSPPKSVEKIFQYIKGRLGEVAGEGNGRNNKGLKQIITGMNSYATTFVNGQLATTVQLIIEKIVDDIGGVSGLRSYLLYSGSQLKSQGITQLQDAVKRKIMEELNKKIITAAQARALSTNQNDVNGNLVAVKTCLTAFAEEVNSNMKNGVLNFTQMATDIAEQLHKGAVRPNSATNNYDLEDAVKITLAAIAETAKQIGEQLDTLRTTSNITYVKNASQVANELFAKLNAATGQPKGTNHAQAVDQAIEAVGATLEQQLKEASGTVTLNGTTEDVFKNYKLHVSQEEDALAALASGNLDAVKGTEGTLPTAINTIGAHGLETFKNKLEKDGQNIAEPVGFLTQITNNIDALMEALVRTGKSINDKLDKLKDKMIGKTIGVATAAAEESSLQKICNDQRKLYICLRDPIQSAKDFQNVADSLFDQTINAIHEYIDQQAEEAISTLTTRARRNYVTSVKQLLTAFATKVTQELQPLPDLINKDLTIGFKGFMKTLEDGTTDVNKRDNRNIRLLSDLKNASSSTADEKKEFFKKLSFSFMYSFESVKEYLQAEITRANEEDNKKKNPPPKGPETLYTQQFSDICTAFEKLLNHIYANKRYDHKVPGLLDDLESALSQLKPVDFSLPNSPTLDGVTAGLGKFTGELRKAYISTYDSQKFTSDLFDGKFVLTPDNDAVVKCDLNTYGEKCAKVCLTVLPTLNTYLNKLRRYSNVGWSEHQIHKSTDLGKFFRSLGYEISQDDKKHWELQDKDTMKGQHVYKRLVGTYPHVFPSSKDTEHAFNVIVNCLPAYYQVGHQATFTSNKSPCNIYQMLTWFCGLPHNRVHKHLTDHILKLFSKPENVDVPKPSDYVLHAYPSGFSAKNVIDSLDRVCSKSHDVLVAIQGHGHAEGIYACDFYTNAENLSYPSNMDTLLCLLLDIAKRIYQQLHFLYQQCTFNTTMSGWSDCWYGHDIGGTAWQCNTLQCPNQNADQIGDQMHNQKANQTAEQTCNQHPKCGLKSPLQSFLEDGLRYYMSHVH
ncbi:hypothetical protein, conserved [Babesia ovata]|uniref:Extracellular matrix-binding ebh n=1 Tax=Babesia ovata TaxID=189622 RepID=A0A2H6KJT5_9APIC|nr:uncharacterized protein BOVATA_047320 [Babesia ovata]GBE63239.1 hypothetical protein, conserved [Babesia ovata]